MKYHDELIYTVIHHDGSRFVLFNLDLDQIKISRKIETTLLGESSQTHYIRRTYNIQFLNLRRRRISRLSMLSTFFVVSDRVHLQNANGTTVVIPVANGEKMFISLKEFLSYQLT